MQQNNTDIVNISDYYDERNYYSRSNFMISSKYRSSLLSNRLMAVSLSRLSTAKESEEGYLTVTVKGRDIQELFGTKGNSFFEQLRDTAHGMTGQTIGWSNPVTKEFEYIAVVVNAQYKAGEFSIEFNKKIKDFLVDLTRNYSVFNLPVMLSLKSSYSFRMVELLRAKCFHRKGEVNTGNLFKIEFDINELRLDLGVVNAELAEVRKILNKSKGKPDYAKAVEASPEKLFESWYEFKRNVIDKSVKEINNTPGTGIHVDSYEPKKSGKGGKVYAVVFYVSLLTKTEDKGITSVENRDNDKILDEIIDLIGIKAGQARSIGEAAGWDLEKVRRNYEYSLTKNVEDIVGFMIKAVKEDWASAAGGDRSRPRASKGRSFSNFTERKYDYDKLANEVIN
ncbi:MAG: replication initiation protein [Lachnospiraceae bacterium]|nr:replication initiation protein [Lachnospiraceae bacterium]